MLRLRAEVARLRQEQAALKRIAAQTDQAETNNQPKTEEPQILITAKFISVPIQNLKDLSWSSIIPKGGVALMDDAQVRTMVQELAKVDGMEMISEPRVQTKNGTPAGLAATHQVPLGGTNATIGVTLNVDPHYSTNSSTITLDVRAGLTELINTSLQQDESQPDLRITIITNSVTLLDGQTILLREDVTSEGWGVGSTNKISGPKSLLLLLTPQIIHDIHPDAFHERLRAIVERKK